MRKSHKALIWSSWREKTQINKIRNKKPTITNTNKIKRVDKDYFEKSIFK
jgi:hypothetical protein